MEFKKYSSIENSFNKEFLEQVVEQMPPDLQYVVQEKVHGANTSFLCDGVNVTFAKRTAVLEADEQFYDYPELLDRYREKVINLFDEIKRRYPNVVSISVFGEMFGGHYPHNAVKSDRKLTLIQKGVCYTPEHEFYGFDIFVFEADKGRYLSVNEINELFDMYGFFYAKTLFEGNLKECLAYPNAFRSRIPQWLGLPKIEDNICEGVVIRPLVPMYLRNGARVLIKNKNERFAEKKSVKKRNKLFAEPIPYSDELNEFLIQLEAFITENRLNNVISHIGEVHLPNDMGKVLGAFSKDIFEDFLKEFGGSFTSLDKCEQKSLTKELNKLALKQIKSSFTLIK